MINSWLFSFLLLFLSLIVEENFAKIAFKILLLKSGAGANLRSFFKLTILLSILEIKKNSLTVRVSHKHFGKRLTESSSI